MEAFGSVAKFLRGGSAAATATTFTEVADTTNTTITAAVSPYSSDGEEDGPYFDLEFTVPEDDIDQEEPTENAQEDDNESRKPENGSSHVEDSEHENEGELKLTVSSNGCTEENVTICSSEDLLLLNGELVPIESSSVLLHESEQSCKFPVSVLKSAAKFGVVLLKLKKSRSEQTENTSKTEENQAQTGRKFLALKFKVEEVKMPFSSLFSRENESKGKKEMKQNAENSESNGVISDNRKSKKKYLKMVKPSYVRVSKGYLEKLKFHGQLNVPGAETGCEILPPDMAAEKGKEGTVKVSVKSTRPKQWNDYLQIGLLAGKGGSASAAVAAVPASKMASNRRDDSLLQVQDGIQGAILHCKRSFNASTAT